MFPERLLDVDFTEPAGQADGRQIQPRYLTSRDHGWVEHALDTVTACVGRPRGEVQDRLRDAPGRGERWRAWHSLGLLLLRLHGFDIQSRVNPTLLRTALFDAAAAATATKGGVDRDTIVAQVARQLQIDAADVDQGLYADLPDARVLKPPSEPLGTLALIERYNLALAQSLLWRSETLEVRLQGYLKAVLRMARLRGLLCLAHCDPASKDAVLQLSGPLSLFHHTVKYGRAMAAWLPVLVRAPRWSLRASCVVGGTRLSWSASYRDPLGTTHVPPRRFDSKLEARLFRDLKRLAPRWEVRREADAIQIGSRIVSPDFTLVDSTRRLRVPIEIVGFWTPEYLRDKLSTLRQLPTGARWVVCVDSSLCADADTWTFPGADVLRFSRRIDATSLLALVEQRFG